MARPGVSYDQVAGAAEALFAEGAEITILSVRERLGTGSMNTVHKHLKAWRANQPKDAPAPVDIPSDVVRSINGWVIQASTAARAAAETEMLRAQGEADVLSKNGAQVEAERDEALDRAAELTSERDQSAALAKERAEEIEGLKAQVARERDAANDAQIRAAETGLKLEAHVQNVADLREDVGRLNGLLDAERLARGQADTKAAVLEAGLNGARRETAAERERANGLQAKLDQAHKDEDAVRDELGQQLQQVAALTAEIEATRKAGAEAAERIRTLQTQLDKAQQDSEAMRGAYEARIERLEQTTRADVAAARAETDKARTEAQAVLLQMSELRGKLAAAEERAARLEASAQKAAEQPAKSDT